MRRVVDVAVIVGFLLVIWVPLYGMYWMEEPDPEEMADTERRVRNEKPKFAWNRHALAAYPRQFEPWFGDSFGYRADFLSLRNHLRWYVLDSSPTESVLKGKDGWLYATWGSATDTWRGVMPMEQWRLEVWRKMLELRRDWLAERGIAYVYVLIPNKNVVYPEYMPDGIERGRSRREQLLAYLAARSDVVVVDPLPAMLEAKAQDHHEDYLYHRLGDHWADRGALVCYREIMHALAPMLPHRPELWPWPPEGFLSLPGRDEGDSWAGAMYLQRTLVQDHRVLVPDPGRDRGARRQILPGDNEYTQRWHNPDLPGGLRALIFHDSFGPSLVAFLAEHFSETVGHWQPEFDTELIETERPDVVIEAFVERVLATGAPRVGGPTAERWLKEEFELADEVLFEADFLVQPGLVEPLQDVMIVPGVVAGVDGVAVHMQSKRGLVYLPEFEIPQDGGGILRLRIYSPARTLLKMSYMTAEDPTYDVTRSFGFQLHTGENDVLITLVTPGARGRLLMRPGGIEGRYVLRSMEVRRASEDYSLRR